jgi:hypothetical protein
MYVFIGDFSTNFHHKIFFIKKGCFAPLCVPLGLKKPGDFTVSEGHGHPLIFIMHVLCADYSYLYNLQS